MEKSHFFKNVLNSDTIAESLEHLQTFVKSFLGSDHICVFLTEKRKLREQVDCYFVNLSELQISRLKNVTLGTDFFSSVPEGCNSRSFLEQPGVFKEQIRTDLALCEFRSIFAFSISSERYSGTILFCISDLLELQDEELQVCSMIRTHMEQVIEKIHFRRQVLKQTVYESLFNALRIKDQFTVNHCYNVSFYSALLGSKLGISSLEIEELKISALLHDIGKLSIPDQILLKPGSLTDAEFRVIREHPVIGYKLLKDHPQTQVGNILPIARWHHERIDGRGYPDGLNGEDIPLMVRLVSIADAFDAMTSSRVYRSSLSIDEVKAQMLINAGTQFDQNLVCLFLEVLQEQTKMKLL